MNLRNILFLISGMLLLSACSTMQMTLPKTLPEPVRVEQKSSVPVDGIAKQKASRVEVFPALSVASWKPDDVRTEQMALPKGLLELSADAMPMNEFIHMALGDVLSLSFEVDASVESRTDPVTLHISKPVKAARLLGMVEQALDVYDVGLAWNNGSLRVLPKSKLNKSIPSLVSSSARLELKKGRVMMILPLRYALAGEVMTFSSAFLQAGGGSYVGQLSRLNALLLLGAPDRLMKLKQAIEMIDRPTMQGKQVRLIKPIYWKVQELVEPLKKALLAQGVKIAQQAGSYGLHLITMEKINALMVISPDQTWTKLLEQWVERLDTVEAVGESSQAFVYFVRQGDAKTLGSTITQVLGAPKAQSSNAKKDGKLAKPKASKTLIKSAGNTFSGGGGGSLRVVIDEEHNALVFIGSARAYRIAHQLLQQLDRPARQVLIEATVADITLDESTQLGVDWTFSNVDNSNALTGTLSTLGGLGVGTGGLTYALVDAAGSIRAKLNALASSGRAKILSSPRLLAKDNEEARIQVGTQVAVVSQEVSSAAATTAAGASLLRSFTYVDTGVILTFTPTVTADGAVQLKISQEVSEAGASNNNTPPIATRNINTTLVAQSGQSIMIGGLITHNKSEQVTKVPLLGDIPIIGHLFSSTQITDRSTEMIVLITPHVISNAEDASALTEAFKSQLGWVSE